MPRQIVATAGGGIESNPAPDPTVDEVPLPHDPLTTTTWVSAMSQPELLLSDVPLFVECLLLEARQLADAGASTEEVEAILDHVVAVRGGCG